MKIENKLKGFTQHGASFTREENGQSVGVCPFCWDGKHFYVDPETTLWVCHKCGEGGNFFQFLEKKSIEYQNNFKGLCVNALCKDKGLAKTTLRAWGVGWADNFYTIPARGNPSNSTTNLLRYIPGGKLIATSGSSMSFSVPLESYDSRIVWLVEGAWDGMALWECFSNLGIQEDIYAAPGAGTFPPKLAQLFYNKTVRVIYDNDAAGIKGMEKVKIMLEGFANSLEFVHWPESLPEGFDVRDYYQAQEKDAEKTVLGLQGMLRLGLKSLELQAKALEHSERLTGAGLGHKEAYTAYKRWLVMEDSKPLDVLFGSIFANRIPGDPLWLFLVAPPGGMKSELLMSVSGAPKIYPISSWTSKTLVSGANFGQNDPSLIPMLNKKVMVIKDFTVILSMDSTARDEIFSVLRDIYDGTLKRQFGAGIIRDYKSTFGILAGVTPAIEDLNRINVALGERFVRYRIKQSFDQDNDSIIRKALLNIEHDTEMRESLENTGTKVLDREAGAELPQISEGMVDRFVNLAKWTSKLRGSVSRERYTGLVSYSPVPEIGTRVVKQLTKLAYGISIYRGEEVISEYTYSLIVEVSMDTLPSYILAVTRALWKHYNGCYHKTSDIAEWVNFNHRTGMRILEDMNLLGIVERCPDQGWGHYILGGEVKELMDRIGEFKIKSRSRKRRIN